ncbi:hypothetical protein JTB14_029445 [Gonioctena quinquepunctata]|nr:hypothetical protein JTB14_029445 [Gonioctena quinquepunctata]
MDTDEVWALKYRDPIPDQKLEVAYLSGNGLEFPEKAKVETRTLVQPAVVSTRTALPCRSTSNIEDVTGAQDNVANAKRLDTAQCTARRNQSAGIALRILGQGSTIRIYE